jgi:hypothetical protein
MLIPVVAVGGMQVTIMEVIEMISVGHGYVATVGAMNMLVLVVD